MNILLKERRFSLRPAAHLQGVGSGGHFRDWGKMLYRWEGREVLSLTWNQQFPFSVLPRRESFLWKARRVFTCSLLLQFGNLAACLSDRSEGNSYPGCTWSWSWNAWHRLQSSFCLSVSCTWDEAPTALLLFGRCHGFDVGWSVSLFSLTWLNSPRHLLR